MKSLHTRGHALRLRRPTARTASFLSSIMASDSRFSSRLSNIKGYVQQARAEPRSVFSTRSPAPTPPLNGQGLDAPRQSWGQWAGQKIKQITRGGEDAPPGIDKLFVFPGWASRHYTDDKKGPTSQGVSMYLIRNGG
jgi:hypothetical protein